MLLTGFDAPLEQVRYLDRSMRGQELLQAIVRVNRTHTGKTCGLVVDYIGVGAHLKKALAVYAEANVEGAMRTSGTSFHGCATGTSGPLPSSTTEASRASKT
jgi:type I site-specific restriction-modification system R (restriction) subunit